MVVLSTWVSYTAQLSGGTYTHVSAGTFSRVSYTTQLSGSTFHSGELYNTNEWWYFHSCELNNITEWWYFDSRELYNTTELTHELSNVWNDSLSTRRKEIDVDARDKEQAFHADGI